MMGLLPPFRVDWFWLGWPFLPPGSRRPSMSEVRKLVIARCVLSGMSLQRLRYGFLRTSSFSTPRPILLPGAASTPSISAKFSPKGQCKPSVGLS